MNHGRETSPKVVDLETYHFESTDNPGTGFSMISICIQTIQGESYVPVLQTKAVVRLLNTLWLIFLSFITILCFSIKINISLLNFFNPGLQYYLQHHFTIVPTCPQHFWLSNATRRLHGGCMEAASLENEIFNTP